MKYLLNVDIYKAIGILFIISGHVWFSNSDFSLYIHSFHVPMFFFLSGFLFHYSEFRDFVIKKFKRLIIPYIVYGIVILLIFMLIIKGFDYSNYLKIFSFINNEPPIPISGALWFLTGLFFANMLFFIICKFPPKYRLFIVLLLTVPEFIFKIKLPYSIDSAIYMLPVMYAGLMFKEYKPEIKKSNKIFIVLAILILSVFPIFFNGDVNVRKNVYMNPLLFYFNAIVISVGWYYFSELIQGVKNINIVALAGKYSLELMCIHQLIIYVFTDKFAVSSPIFLFILTMLVSATVIFLQKMLVRKVR